MKLFMLKADSSKDMEGIAEELSEKKFKAIERQDNFILMRKRRFGNVLIHIVSLLLALFFTGLFIFVNVVYFTYSYLWASPHVLITTERTDEEGNALEFDEMDDVLNKAFAIL